MKLTLKKGENMMEMIILEIIEIEYRDVAIGAFFETIKVVKEMRVMPKDKELIEQIANLKVADLLLQESQKKSSKHNFCFRIREGKISTHNELLKEKKEIIKKMENFSSKNEQKKNK